VARASLILRRKWTDEDGNLYEIVIWKVDRSRLYPEAVRYRLAFIRADEEVPAVLYDNHHPKGHHRHVGRDEEAYAFTTTRQLVSDFVAHAAALTGEVK
jgi:DNA-binding LacI/PurR family transcriptional regulator